jgi:hypothetical protein
VRNASLSRAICLYICCASVALLAGCNEEEANEPEEEAFAVSREGVAALEWDPSCDSQGPFVRCWQSSSEIDVGITPAAYLPELATVLNEYNVLLRQGSAFSPEFALDSGLGADVRVSVYATAPSYCGKINVTVKPFVVSLYSSLDPQCTGANVGDLERVLKHELTQALGWVDQAEGYASRHGGVGISDNCSLFLPSPVKILNPYVCLHDVQAAFMRYSGEPFPLAPEEYFGRPIFQASDLDRSPLSLWIGDTAQLEITRFVSDSPPSAYPVQIQRTLVQANLESSDLAVANVSATGLVVASGSGAAWIKVRPQAVPGYRAWMPFAVLGDSVRVTVAAPPPPPPAPLRITDIWTPEGPPLTQAGSHTFTATWTGGPGGTPDSVRWQIDDTRTGPGIDVTVMRRGSMQLTRLIQAGDYSLQFTALPYKGGQAGFAYAEDFPVCTGDGGQAGTNAEGGCGGGGNQ